jgi:hypothetical protein
MHSAWLLGMAEQGHSHLLLYCTLPYSIVLHWAVLYCTVLYCTVLYCIVLYCTVLHHTLSYCTVMVPHHAWLMNAVLCLSLTCAAEHLGVQQAPQRQQAQG